MKHKNILKNIPTIEILEEYVKLGKLSCSKLDYLRLYNYTKNVVYNREWDDVTTIARGLIIDSRDNSVAAISLPKFFNWQEYGVDVVIPEGKPDVATIKEDGSLGISYYYMGELRWATRGSFYSEHAAAAQEMWDRNYSHIKVPKNWTLIAEIIHPISENVVHYDFEDLILLGIRNIETGEDYSYDHVLAWGTKVGMKVVEKAENDFELLKAQASKLDSQHEGFVLRWGDLRIKVKGQAYCEVARILQGLTDRAVADYWYFGLSAPTGIPEENREWFDAKYSEMDSEVEALRISVEALYQATHEKVSAELDPLLPASSQVREYRKQFVSSLNKKDRLFSLVMSLVSEQQPDYKLDVYRHHFPGTRPRIQTDSEGK